MDPSEALRLSDPAVVARYLFLRSLFQDRILGRIEDCVVRDYDVRPSHGIAPTLTCLTRTGFVRPGEGELWPVVFLTAVDVTLALCVQFTPERLANLGTVLHGPQRIRHRHWESWWGWEASLGEIHPQFFELPADRQTAALMDWYHHWLEWLVSNGLLTKKRALPGEPGA
jgi:hypothetical protein